MNFADCAVLATVLFIVIENLILVFLLRLRLFLICYKILSRNEACVLIKLFL